MIMSALAESSSTAKVSFGFSKKLDTKLKAPPRAASDSNLPGQLFTNVDQSEVAVSRDLNGETDELIIPLIKRNRWQGKNPTKQLSKNAHGSQSLSNLPDIIEIPVEESNNAQTASKGCFPDERKELTEDERAAAEIMKDIQKLHIVNEDEEFYMSMEIPLWMENRLPPGFETDEKLNVELRAEESTMEDYEKIPIDKYGMAMLRGMGWKEDEGIGKTHKKTIKPVQVKIRPRGLGLGAVPVAVKKGEKKDEDKKQEKILVGSYVMITQGRYENRVGEISGIDGDVDRWLICLVGEEKRTVSICGVSLKVISEQEYGKAGRYLNNDRYYDYKVVQEDRLDTIRRQITEKEKRSSSDKSKDGDGQRKDYEKEKTRRKDDEGREVRPRDEKKDRRKKRHRSRSRSRSPRR